MFVHIVVGVTNWLGVSCINDLPKFFLMVNGLISWSAKIDLCWVQNWHMLAPPTGLDVWYVRSSFLSNLS